MVTAGWGRLALFPSALSPSWLSPPKPPAALEDLNFALQWIPFSMAATQKVNKIHCSFAPRSSSVFWHIQMPALKRVNNENDVFSSRHSKQSWSEACEGAAGRRRARGGECPVGVTPWQPHGLTALQTLRKLVWHVMTTLKEGFSFEFMTILTFTLKDSFDVLKFMNLYIHVHGQLQFIAAPQMDSLDKNVQEPLYLGCPLNAWHQNWHTVFNGKIKVTVTHNRTEGPAGTFTVSNTWIFAENYLDMKVSSETNMDKGMGSKGWMKHTAQGSTQPYNLASQAKLHKENAGPEF